MEDLSTIKQHIERASRELGDICADGPHVRFRMRIPAQPDYDSDLIIGQALKDAKDLADEVERLTADRIISCVFAVRSGECPLPFALYRRTDETGVSGEGTVAYGVQFADGTVVIRWLGDYASTVVWDDLEKAMQVHGHRGSTRVVWLAEQFEDLAEIEAKAERAEKAEAAIERAKEIARHPRTSQGRVKDYVDAADILAALATPTPTEETGRG